MAGLAGLIWVAACGEPAPGGDRRVSDPATDDMSAMPGMADMEGMAGADPAATAFWDSMRAHLDSVVRLEPNRLVFVRAAHDSLARLALERMDREMTGMSMPADGAWRALADSVRRDLATLRTLAGEPFVLRMRGTAGRLRRLIERHKKMMAAMGAPARSSPPGATLAKPRSCRYQLIGMDDLSQHDGTRGPHPLGPAPNRHPADEGQDRDARSNSV